MNSQQLIKMIDDYADTRHTCGSHLYNEKAALLESSTDYYQRIGWLLIEQKCVIESLKGENNAN